MKYELAVFFRLLQYLLSLNKQTIAIESDESRMVGRFTRLSSCAYSDRKEQTLTHNNGSGGMLFLQQGAPYIHSHNIVAQNVTHHEVDAMSWNLKIFVIQ